MSKPPDPNYERFKGEPIVLSVRLDSTCPHGKLSNECCGAAEWLRVIHAVNGELPEEQRQALGFREPLAMYDWWADHIWCEEYPAWRVLIRPDHTTNLQAKTAAAAEQLKHAVQQVTGRVVDHNGMTLRYERIQEAPRP